MNKGSCVLPDYSLNIIFFVRPLYILSREWRVIVDQVQTNYPDKPMEFKSARCDRTVDY